MFKKVAVLTDNISFWNSIEEKLSRNNLSFTFFSNKNSLIEKCVDEMYPVVIVDLDTSIKFVYDFISEMEALFPFFRFSFFLFVDKNQLRKRADMIVNMDICDYITRPPEIFEVKQRLALIFRRRELFMDKNPLSGLPGNNEIMRYTQMLLARREPFCFIYVDMDNFKPYNDYYGFARGDEVIRMLSRLLLNQVKAISPEKIFVGHIGGDDFVLITPYGLEEMVCSVLIKSFDEIIPSFYDERDRKLGYIIAKDRRGKLAKYPIISLSIGIVEGHKFSHFGEISERASQLKLYAKKFPESMYMRDRRGGSYDSSKRSSK